MLIGGNSLDVICWIQAAKRLGVVYSCLPQNTAVDSAVTRVRMLGAALVYVSQASIEGRSNSGRLISALRKYAIVVSGGRLKVDQILPLEERQSESSAPPGCEDAAVLRNRALFAHPAAHALRSRVSQDFIRAIWADVSPVPVEANTPLFIAFTSGSTGEPKGLVHCHGAVAGICDTLSYTFGVPAPQFDTEGEQQEDVALVVATPAWITGQSYMISACLMAGISSVLLEGSPVAPHPTRFARVIERYRVTVFKAGSTFLRQVMTDPRGVEELQRCDLSSLRVASFCAEPVSPAVHVFAVENICRHYVNSYWASEHGGIVFTRPYQLLHVTEEGTKTTPASSPPDAKCCPLPWLRAKVMVASHAEGKTSLRDALVGERGEIVLNLDHPFPTLARTLWGDKEQFDRGSTYWRGNFKAWQTTYFRSVVAADGAEMLVFIQGDHAEQHSDGSFSFHGRSDDVMNVGGVRIGTGEVEAALFKHKQIHKAHSALGNCVVVGAPDSIKGEVPVCFCVAAPGCTIDAEVQAELQGLAITAIGTPLAAPAWFCTVNALPQTRTGKYLRRLLRDLVIRSSELSTDTTRSSNQDGERYPGICPDTADGALCNPESLEEARAAVASIRAAQAMQRRGSSCSCLQENESEELYQMVLSQASEAVAWESSAGRNTISANTIDDQSMHQSSETLDLEVENDLDTTVSLMHLGFDSMRLVMFRDALLRVILPQGVTAPVLFSQLFGEGSLEAASLNAVIAEIRATFKLAGKQYKPQVGNDQATDGNSTDTLVQPRRRAKGSATILERDNRKPVQGADGGLSPVGGLEACFRGDLVKARSLAASQWCPQYAECQQGSTAMMWAASGGHLEVLEWLVRDCGCDINARNKVKRTALMFAAKYGHHECLRWLISTGAADTSLRAEDDSGVFDWAVFGGDLMTLRAAAELLPPAELHAANRFGCTAVHWAASGGNVAVLRWLNEHGLDFTVVNDAGHGCVQKAAWRGHEQALQWLMLDKDGPRLLWQLQPLVKANVDNAVGGDVAADELVTPTLASLVQESGCSSIRDWGAMECQRR
eukprot:COSAG02_NODE_3376_length_6847_cov_2.337433_2_plen_1057_part_00